MGEQPQPFEIEIPECVFADLRERLQRTRWPQQPERGVGARGRPGLRCASLCSHWADDYDPERLPGLLNRFANYRWQGLHLIHEQGGGRPAAAAAARLAGRADRVPGADPAPASRRATRSPFPRCPATPGPTTRARRSNIAARCRSLPRAGRGRPRLGALRGGRRRLGSADRGADRLRLAAAGRGPLRLHARDPAALRRARRPAAQSRPSRRSSRRGCAGAAARATTC